MKQFKKLIDTVKYGKRLSTGNTITGDDKDVFYGLAKACQPIVFQSPLEFDYGSWFLDAANTAPKTNDQKILFPGLQSAPFPVFSLECLNSPLYTYRDPKKDGLIIWCIMAVEVRPLEFDFYFLTGHEPSENVYWSRNESQSKIAEIYVSAIKTKLVFSESVDENLKLGGKERKTKTNTIRRIIRICEKREAASVKPEFSKEIDWSHRWLVRGHWRKTDALGKDRNGDYCVAGYTWVKDHEKGPQELPLIHKTRILRNRFVGAA